MTGKTVLVTGASGFIGKVVCSALLERGYSVRASTSDPKKRDLLHDYLQDNLTQHDLPGMTDNVNVRNRVTRQSIDAIVIHTPSDFSGCWDKACHGVDTIIHLAGRAHIIRETVSDPLSACLKINRDISVSLAESAVNSGVSRIVYVSSIGVNGKFTSDSPMHVSDIPRPHDPYSQSKLEAERELKKISEKNNLELVIVRPPLVYGPGAKGNFPRLLKLVYLGLPLPLSRVNNVRSMIGVQNLADLLVVCAFHPRAAGNVFLVSDGVNWSTAELIKKIANHMKKPARLFPFPVRFLRILARMTGQSGAIDRLCGSLEIDIERTREVLGWSPPQLPDEGLQKAVEWYMGQKKTA